MIEEGNFAVKCLHFLARTSLREALIDDLAE